MLELNLEGQLEIICKEREPCELRKSECYHTVRDKIFSMHGQYAFGEQWNEIRKIEVQLRSLNFTWLVFGNLHKIFKQCNNMMKFKLQKEPYRWLKFKTKYLLGGYCKVQGRDVEGLNRGSSYRYRREDQFEKYLDSRIGLGGRMQRVRRVSRMT